MMEGKVKRKLYRDEKRAVSAATEIRACMNDPDQWQIITHRGSKALTGGYTWVGLVERDGLQVCETRGGAYLCIFAEHPGTLAPEASTHPADAVQRVLDQAARKVGHLMGVLAHGEHPAAP